MWLQHFVAVMGGGGIFAVAFLDSSVLSFPFITDALVMKMCIDKPSRMLYYAAMATLGSLLGCIWIYWLAKKGGEVYFHRHGGRYALKAKRWVDSHAFLSLFIPAILPPPMQFKVFVLAEGVFQVPLGRSCSRWFWGEESDISPKESLLSATARAPCCFWSATRVSFILAVIALLLLLYLANRLALHTSPAQE